MKKIKYLLIVVVLLLIGNLDVLALSKSEYDDFKISYTDGSVLCYYQIENTDFNKDMHYLAILFSYNEQSKKYTVVNKSGHNSSLSNASNNTTTFDDANCKKYYFWLENSGSEYKILFDTDDSEYLGQAFKYKNITKSDEEEKSEVSGNTCNFSSEIDGGKQEFIFGSYSDSDTFFSASTNKNAGITKNIKICPATSNDGTNFEAKTIKDFGFSCDDSKFKVIPNPDVNLQSNCDYLLVDKSLKVNVKELEISETGDLITTYVEFASANAPSIRIIKNSDGTYKAVLASGSKIEAITSGMINTNVIGKESYPKYLIKGKGMDKYLFSDNKTEEFDKIYINSQYLNSIQGLGKEEIYEKCEEIFGESFLEWLDKNVFMIIRIGVPILLILLTTFDFAKVVFNDDKDGMQNAFTRFRRRAIAAILIFLTPTIIMLIANLVGGEDLKSVTDCVNYIENMHETSN